MDARPYRFGPTAALLLGLVAGCSDSHAKTLSASAAPEAQTEASLAAELKLTLIDRELASWQSELLELSYEAVSGMPLVPHVKNRSRAQERVVVACFELDQPRRAARYLAGIENWRQGTGYADLAYYGAEHGEQREVVDALLARAHALAHPPIETNEQGEEVREQAWRLDRIKAKIARALLVQGRSDEAAVYEAGLTESERGLASDLRAKAATDEDFDALLGRLEAVLTTGTFDEQKNEIAASVYLYDRFYGDVERRAIVERTLCDRSTKLPVDLRVGLLIRMADCASSHGEAAQATRLVDDAQALIDTGQWGPELHVPLLARLARARHAVGDSEAAEQLAHAAWVVFDSGRARVADVFRAETIRPLAEAYAVMGNLDKARWAYGSALKEGARNPNSWPRSEDLADTLCSMATHDVEPNEELWSEIRRTHEGLGPPW